MARSPGHAHFFLSGIPMFQRYLAVSLALAGLALAACAQTPVAQTCVKPNIDELIAVIDSDRDGKLTHAEWQAAGLPDSSFNGLSKGQGYVDPVFWRTDTPPPGIDMNGDCVITQTEFQLFDKSMSAKTANMPLSASPHPAGLPAMT